MRVTFVLAEANLSGGVRVVATYAEKLKQRGHEVTVVSVRPQPRTLKERFRDWRQGYGWPPRDRSGPSHLDGLEIEHRIVDRRLVEERHVPDADVVVATWWETAEWVWRLSAAKGAKAYFLQHDESTFFSAGRSGESESVVATWRLPMRKMAVARWIADRVMACGCGPVAVVPNSVDLDRFTAPPRGRQARPTMGTVYSTVPFKGTDLVLRAWNLAKERVPELGLVAFSLDQPARVLPLPTGARFDHMPPQERIPGLYASCDAWLFGSRSEGFGLPILEAMACRTPVIGTPAGAAPELLSGGGGVLLSGMDAGEMAEAIVGVARMSEPEWRVMSDAAWRTARGYTWDDAADLMEAELLAAAERGRREPTGVESSP
jgi:glycosyltransferase involved in cell wall biosynthesis